MVPFDLQEFAELRYRDGEPFGLDILKLLDLEPEAEMGRELLEALEKATGKIFPDGEEWRHIEHLADKAQALDEVTDRLKKLNYEGDLDEMVTSLLAKLEDAETELEALKAPDVVAEPLEYDL